MFAKKETAHGKKDSTNRNKEVQKIRDGLPFPEPGTERELLHNRRYVRENIGAFREKSWIITSMLPILFTAAGSAAAINNLTTHSHNPVGAVGAWAGAEGVVAVFSYLSMLSMFRGNKVPKTYIAGVVLATLAAIFVNVIVTPNLESAESIIAALAPVATAASVSAVFKVIRGCLDDAARLEFFELHRSEAADLLRTKQLSRTPEEEAAQDEALEIVLRHTPQARVADLLGGQVNGLLGTLDAIPAAPELEAPKSEEIVEAEADDTEDDEEVPVAPLRVVDNERTAVMHPSQGHRMVLPEDTGAAKNVLTVKLPEGEAVTKMTPVKRARRELARLYWETMLNNRNLKDADFRRNFVTQYRSELSNTAVFLLDRNGEWERTGEIKSPYLSKLKQEFPVEEFLGEVEGLEALVS